MKTKSIATLLGLILLVFGAAPRLGAQTFSVLHNFTNSPDGANPGGLLLSGTTLLGVTGNGGLYGNGSVFACSTNGAGLTALHSFTNAPDGAQPNELLLNGSFIYGTTQSGGTNSWGTIYRMATNGTGYTLLHTFTNGLDGWRPYAGLITDGNFLYGTAAQGGTGGYGTVFRLDTNGGNFTALHSFTNKPDGANPYAALAVSGTNLYGTTFNGGFGTNGTIFKISTNGAGYAVLYNFSNVPAASYPSAGLVVASNVIYGTSSQGGNSNSGTIFKLGTDGTGFAILHHFTGLTTPASASDGGSPAASLTLSGSLFYGVTTIGGSGVNSAGTIYQMNTNGTGFTVLKSLESTTDGSFSEASVILGANSLYGTGFFGGSGNAGTIFNLLFSPTITAPPQNLTVTSGSSAGFNVTATDLKAINYQWYFNTNTLLAGQTNSTLTLAIATNNNAGAYTVVVSDSFGSVTSSPAVLTVTTVITPPTVTGQPQPQSVTNGFAANFSATASGSTPLFYQWYFNTNTVLAGQTNSTLTFTAVSNNGGYYSVIVTNTAGAATSTAALLTILPAAAPAPTITTQPQSLTVTNGNPATFSVTATNGTLTYQWYFNTNSLLAGQTNSAVTIASTTTNDAGAYTVVVANSSGAVTSSPAILTVSVNTKPIITAQPQNLIVTNGNLAAFSVTAVGLNPLRFQWYSNSVATAIGTLLANQTNSSYSFTSITNASGKFYSVVITNTLGKTTSSPALLTVVSAPLITTNPQPLTVHLGDPATFSVTALGLNLRYQWYSNTVATAVGTVLTNQTNSAFSFTPTTNANGRFYSVIITNTFGRATSSPALLTVSSLPYFTLQPLDAAITNGDAISFIAAAAGPGVLAYQWFFQTNGLITGATNASLIFTNANQPGAYSIKVTNSFGAATSSVAQLSVVGRPIILSAKFDATSGSYAFSYVNLAASTNRLWASTNLTATNFWRVLATNRMATNALWFYTDTNTAKTNNARFYRFSTP